MPEEDAGVLMPLSSSSQTLLLFSSILRHKGKGGGMPEEDAGVLMPGQRPDLRPPPARAKERERRERMTLQACTHMRMRTHDCDAKICAGVLLCLYWREGACTWMGMEREGREERIERERERAKERER